MVARAIDRAMGVVAAMLVVGSITAVAVSNEAAAREPREMPGDRKAVVVGEWAFERLDRAHKALAEEKYDETLAVLEEMKKNKRLNEHEQSLMWQTYGYVYSSQENYEQATESFEKCLEAGGLPPQAELNTRYNLAQLYLMLERYDDAVPMLEEWFNQVDSPAPSAYYALAVAYVQTGDREKALRYAKQAVIKSDAPKEPWLQLLLGFYLESTDYEKSVEILEQLVARFPRKLYWVQLSAAYSALDQGAQALAVLELAHMQGLLTEEGELVHLAQLYFYNGIPLKAARVLNEGLEARTISADSDSYHLLANAWLYARERENAVMPLERAAELSAKGELYVSLAHVRLEREEWLKAASALHAAFRKGQLNDPGSAHLMLGIANANAKNWEAAEQALEKAKEFEKTGPAAAHWLARVENEKALSGASEAN